MKQIKRFTVIALVAAVAFIGINTSRAGYWGDGPQPVIDSANTVGNNTADTCTNGYFPKSITSTTTCTNLVQLNRGLKGAKLLVQITHAANAACTTNAIYVLTESVRANTITNNIIGAGQYGTPLSTSIRSAFCQITLPFNGTTPVTTNLLFSATTTPAFAEGDNVFIETITPGATASMFMTNYSMVVIQSGL